MNKIKMLYYERIDISEGTDINETSASKECDTCHYWYFYLSYLCNKCDDLLMMSMSLSDIATLNIKGYDYQCIISRISKSETKKLNVKYQFDQKREIL